ncbi:hypothetical protein FRX31_002528 [Thalictrum thalictroides]|uniref:Uncharacterized protein n=1 Tax=Thalictrum thalictroides TaxID=46969 RepID=A0A7J6XG03_THATH|nr:hypothetical protein FRX31_002528 [Thalictrum thalictroides]
MSVEQIVHLAAQEFKILASSEIKETITQFGTLMPDQNQIGTSLSLQGDKIPQWNRPGQEYTMEDQLQCTIKP